MTAPPTWIAPGDAATLVWHSGRGEGAEGAAVHLVAGPALDTPPPFPHFLLAPADRDECGWTCRFQPFEFSKEAA
jgi:hypothetical protein